MKETVYETFSAAETHALGKKIGETAKPGDVYTLVGDLGVGKTVFTQGIADGLGITEPVSSPTFTIVQVYEEGRMPFYHFDVYRIGDIEKLVTNPYFFPFKLRCQTFHPRIGRIYDSTHRHMICACDHEIPRNIITFHCCDVNLIHRN